MAIKIYDASGAMAEGMANKEEHGIDDSTWLIAVKSDERKEEAVFTYEPDGACVWTNDVTNEAITDITNKEIKEYDDSIHDINAGIVRLKKLLKKDSVVNNFQKELSALDKAVADVDKVGKDFY